MKIITPLIFKQFPRIKAVQSTRLGGYKSEFGDFNLGESVGDDPETVSKNRDLFCSLAGFNRSNLAKSKQVHGAEILWVEKGGSYEGYDALVTNQSDILLAVTIADCAPILIYNEKRDVTAAIHAGWQGTKAMLVTKVLKFMESNFKSQAKDLYVFIGPCISAKNYEVDADVALYFDEKYREKDSSTGKYHLDIKKHNFDQLTAYGIPEDQIEVSGYCTVEHKDLFYTHRGDKGRSGRMLAAIGVKTV